ncbi:hypothetical protein HK102_009062, partial [Quaeritorhiza haematococci]
MGGEGVGGAVGKDVEADAGLGESREGCDSLNDATLDNEKSHGATPAAVVSDDPAPVGDEREAEGSVVERLCEKHLMKDEVDAAIFRPPPATTNQHQHHQEQRPPQSTDNLQNDEDFIIADVIQTDEDRAGVENRAEGGDSVDRRMETRPQTVAVYFAHRRYEGYPAKHVQLRSIDEETFRVIDVTTNMDIEDIEKSRVPFTLYEGSILIHQGKTFMVFDVDMERKFAKVRPTNVDYQTANREFVNVDPIKTLESRAVVRLRREQSERTDGVDMTSTAATGTGTDLGPEMVAGMKDMGRISPEDAIWAHYGEVQVCITIFGYIKYNPKTKQVLEAVDDLENPPLVKFGRGFWIDVPPATVLEIQTLGLDLEFSIHAAAHSIISLMPAYVRVPTNGKTNILTECKSLYARRIRPPRIVIYEDSRGGGITQKGFQHISELVHRALR